MNEIRPHSPEDCLEVSNFFNLFFPSGPAGIQKRSKALEYFKWRYGPTPFGENIIYHYWENGKILGTFGAIPQRISIRGQDVLAYQLIDAFVCSHLHGKGIFRKLGDIVFSNIDAVSNICFGMAPSPLSLPIFTQKYNMYVAIKYKQIFSPVFFKELFKMKKLRFLLPVAKFASKAKVLLSDNRSLEVRELFNVDEEHLLIPAPDNDVDICTMRDWQYFHFRYITCPERYHFYKIQDKSHNLIFVVKFIMWNNMQICYLIDIFSDNYCKITFDIILKGLLKIGYATQTPLVSAELHNYRINILKLFRFAYIVHRREECVFMRQNKWDFLNPKSNNYNESRWVIFSGDSDYI